MSEETTSSQQPLRIALAYHLSHCPAVLTLGVKTNLADYSPRDRALIQNASKIYFPTIFYADALDAMGKEIFPSVQCYRYLGDKIRQMLLFDLLAIPMPKTRIFYGKRQRETVKDYFGFPCIGKVPVGSSRGEGVYLIRGQDDLEAYLSKVNVAYIQQYIPIKKDIRVVILGRHIIHAYWKKSASGEFRTNVARGGKVLLDPVPKEALALALDVAIRCRFDHVGLDICRSQNKFLVLEANMNFGTHGFQEAGIDYKALLCNMVRSNEI
ncbi:MAG: ATP-grasp domain-containing protein [Nitrospiraceae bacterium]|nr:ATP-grasp domain-containing protein [Nitrospiraceae bacterium]